MADYRIDELARQAGTTVRNVRVYQDRGLLAPPRRDGRVGIYTDAHLARLRLIGQLLRRGYTFANIGELLTVWERGGDLADIFDLESAVGDPWTDDMPAYVTPEGLRELFGAEVTEENLERSFRLGLLEPDGDRYRVPSPRLLQAGAELVSIGMRLPAVLDLAERLRVQVDAVASDLVGTVNGHILATHAPGGMLRGEEIAEVAAIARRMRPLARMAVESLLAQSMTRHVQDALAEHFAEVLEHLVREKAADAASRPTVLSSWPRRVRIWVQSALI
ncbi:MAG: MerR family transcriptional regulator [Streptosporangiaceae bacterium]|nr:MerR family transcriptional regulator [Streptosporangiaceae bacterium]